MLSTQIESAMKTLYKRLITGVSLGLLVISLFFLSSWAFALLVLGLLMRILIWEWPRLFSPEDPKFWLIMPLYPILPMALIIYMQLTGYELVNLLLICLVAAHDTGAYLIGKHWGKHKISPAISPGKTWEGFIGGCVLSFLFSLIFFGGNPLALIIGTILPFVLSVNFAALAGDLFESTLKRRAGLKDAGTMLPGHGGVLDRVDGILFAAVLVFLVRKWIVLLF